MGLQIFCIKLLHVMIWSHFAWYGPQHLPEFFRNTTQNLYYEVYIFIEKMCELSSVLQA